MPSDIVAAALTYAQAYRSLHQALSKALTPFNLTLLEWTFLQVVAEKPDLTMSQYAHLMAFDAPHITQLSQTLEATDLLEVKPSHHDKRQKCVSLTSQGKKQTTAAGLIVRQTLEIIFKNVTPADTRAHLRVLDQIISHTQT